MAQDNLARVEEAPPGRPPHSGFISVVVSVNRGGIQEVGTQKAIIFRPGIDNEPGTVEAVMRGIAAWYAEWCAMNNVQ